MRPLRCDYRASALLHTSRVRKATGARLYNRCNCVHCLSQATVERLGLGYLIDKRFSGTAKGVGAGKIVGKIHQVHPCLCCLPKFIPAHW